MTTAADDHLSLKDRANVALESVGEAICTDTYIAQVGDYPIGGGHLGAGDEDCSEGTADSNISVSSPLGDPTGTGLDGVNADVPVACPTFSRPNSPGQPGMSQYVSCTPNPATQEPSK